MRSLNLKAEALLARHNHYAGEGLQNHNRRLAEFALALAQDRGREVNPDLVRAVTTLHDIGLLVRQQGQPSYLKRGWEFVEPHVLSWGVEGDSLVAFRDMMLYNHALPAVRGVHPWADLVRRAVQVEHSLGLVRHGLPRRVCREVFSRLPRLNFHHVLYDFARTTVVEDGIIELIPMFFPRGPTGNRRTGNRRTAGINWRRS